MSARAGSDGPLPVAALRRLRQLGSRAPGHPEQVHLDLTAARVAREAAAVARPA